MGCNAWNHHPDCDCGWGGDTGGYGLRPPVSQLSSIGGALTVESFLRPNSMCPICGASVYFFQSTYGGRVYFDDIGAPWPKHPCFDTKPINRGSFKGVLESMNADLSPQKSLLLAAELIKHAMSDFREPKRVWPNEELEKARREVIDWLFRRHSDAAEHLVPLDEFLTIIGFIEKSANSTLASSKIFSDPLMIHDEEKRQWWMAQGSKAQATIAAMTRLRKHYETVGKFVDDPGDNVVVPFGPLEGK